MSAPLTIVTHPLAEVALAQLRNRATTTDAFRHHSRRLAHVLAITALADIPTKRTVVTTPLETTTGAALAKDVVFVPVLRAGLALLDAMSDIVPSSKVGFIGLERDETTAVARHYYQKLPAHLADAQVVLLDPMVATGGSATAAISLLRSLGARTLRLVCVVATPQGVGALHASHPDVIVITAALDRGLDDRSYIVPGLGDFGDRYFGTE